MGKYTGQDAVSDLSSDYKSSGSNPTPQRNPAGGVSAANAISKSRRAKGKVEAKGKVKTGSNNQEGSGDFKKSIQNAGAQGLAQGGGGGMDAAGNALMMSGNPYAMAAGGALKVIGAVKAKKEKAAQAKADAENNRRAKLQSALANLGSGIGSIGMA